MSLYGPDVVGGPEALAAAQTAYMDALFADALGYAGVLGTVVSARLFTEETDKLKCVGRLYATQERQGQGPCACACCAFAPAIGTCEPHAPVCLPCLPASG